MTDYPLPPGLVNGVVVTVFASQYIDLVAKKGLGKTETKNAYYSGVSTGVARSNKPGVERKQTSLGRTH